ncbi:hypothetical protein B1A87_005285 [Arthrobacter sp. KBS0703]|uniref:hypothetical protein n=1 Tax=Arthrobacter sp. KBS0703 TaxID=1955698 RepID=UPI00098F5D71|nr:hypothetical protein [Arthrobacter sp. KBS0703]TSE15410.1 hypothetical protein B1A87_005285 [Arthrobacter sp. KBS0703]
MSTAPHGPWIPEGIEEFGEPGTFNRGYAAWLAGQPERDAEIARNAAENTARITAEIARTESRKAMTDFIITPLHIDALDGVDGEAPIPPRWKSLKWTKAAAKFGNLREKPAFFKISDGPGWWVLDDISRGAVGDDIACGSGWNLTSQESLERVKLLFRILGVDDRLTIRENPEWATPYDPNRAQAGVRAGRR